MEVFFLWLRKPLLGFVTIVTLRQYSVNTNQKLILQCRLYISIAMEGRGFWSTYLALFVCGL